MANRTPKEEWGRLFNFAGAGFIHLELFEEFVRNMAGPTWLELIAAYLLLRGTHSARPDADEVPEGCEYYESDTQNRFKAVGGAWVADGQSGSGGSGALTLVGTILVEEETTDVTFEELDGDNDGTYYLIGHFVNFTGGNTGIFLRPNGESTDQATVTSGNNEGSTSFAASSGLEICGAVDSLFADFSATIHPHTGTARTFSSQNIIPTGGTVTQLYASTSYGRWDDDAANITELTLHANNTDAIQPGSRFSLYKLTA